MPGNQESLNACQDFTNGHFQDLASHCHTQLCGMAPALMLTVGRSQRICLGCPCLCHVQSGTIWSKPTTAEPLFVFAFSHVRAACRINLYRASPASRMQGERARSPSDWITLYIWRWIQRLQISLEAEAAVAVISWSGLLKTRCPGKLMYNIKRKLAW